MSVETPLEPAPQASRPDRRPAPRGGNRRKVLLVTLGLVAVLLVPVALVGGWIYLQLDPRGGYGDPVVVTVEDGWGAAQIGDELAARGVIGSALVYQLTQRDANVGAGTYELYENMGVWDAASELAAGPDAVPEVGVLPGLTLDEVGDRVAGIRRFSKARFVQLATDGRIRSRYQPAGVDTLEGLLAPDSHPVPLDQTEADLTQAMVVEFDARAGAAGIDAAAARLGLSPYEVVTVASLVQREAALDEDRPLIAAVVYNRLRAGMPLQIDATREYATQAGRPEYDTYAIGALPPTPIATVSAASLEAAMHPADVSYRFYVLADANGKHVFSDTYEQHLEHVAASEAQGLL